MTDQTLAVSRATAATASRAMIEHRTTLRRKRDQLNKRPVGRNWMARERQLKAYDDQIAALTAAAGELYELIYVPLIRDLTGTTR